MSKKKPSYTDAVRELEEILEGLEEEEVDIDDLSDKVERAASLIRLCREKLSATESRVTKVVNELEVSDNEGEGSSDSEGAPSTSSRKRKAKGRSKPAPEGDKVEDHPKKDGLDYDEDELPF